MSKRRLSSQDGEGAPSNKKQNLDTDAKLDPSAALRSAAHDGVVEEVCRLLAKGHTDVHQSTHDDGWTALMWASIKGHVRVVRILVAHGADVTQGTTDNGRTALMVASDKGHAEVVRILLVEGHAKCQSSHHR